MAPHHWQKRAGRRSPYPKPLLGALNCGCCPLPLHHRRKAQGVECEPSGEWLSVQRATWEDWMEAEGDMWTRTVTPRGERPASYWSEAPGCSGHGGGQSAGAGAVHLPSSSFPSLPLIHHTRIYLGFISAHPARTHPPTHPSKCEFQEGRDSAHLPCGIPGAWHPGSMHR